MSYWHTTIGASKKLMRNMQACEQILRNGRGWIKVMYLDAIVAMIIYTIVTVAFYLLGAAVLYQRAGFRIQT